MGIGGPMFISRGQLGMGGGGSMFMGTGMRTGKAAVADRPTPPSSTPTGGTTAASVNDQTVGGRPPAGPAVDDDPSGRSSRSGPAGGSGRARSGILAAYSN